MSVTDLLPPISLLAGVVLLAGGVALIVRAVRARSEEDQAPLVALGVGASLIGLAAGTLGFLASADLLTLRPVALPPTVPPPEATRPPLVVTATPLPSPIPTLSPSPRPTQPIPTATVRPRRSPSATATPATPSPSTTATAFPYAALLAQARAYEALAAQARGPDAQETLLRQAQAIARALLAANPCEYTFQALFTRICRKLDLLGVGGEACAGAPLCPVASLSGTPLATVTP